MTWRESEMQNLTWPGISEVVVRPVEALKPMTAWTYEQEDIVRRHWARGDTASQIARVIGVTRNAVIGKINRMKLSRRSAQILDGTVSHAKAERNQRKMTRPVVMRPPPLPVVKPASPTRPDAWAPLPGTQPVPLEERQGCAWPVSSGSPYLFCDAETTDKARYCPHHETMSVRKL